MASRELQYVIDGVVNSSFGQAIRRATQGMNNLNHQNNQTARSTGNVIRSMAGAAIGVAAAYVSVDLLRANYADCIQEAKGMIAAQARLDQLMGNVKSNTKASIQAVSEYADVLQGLTAIDGDVIRVGASQLATFALNADAIKTLLPAMADLMSANEGLKVSERGAINAANMMGKVFTGQVGALSKAGVTLDAQQAKLLKTGTTAQKVSTLVKVLNANFGGLAVKRGKEAEADLLRMGYAIGDLKAQIGVELLPLQQKWYALVSKSLPAISKMLDQTIARVKPALAGIGGTVMRVLQPVMAFVNTKVLPLVRSIGADLGKMFVEAWPLMQPALQTIGAGIANLVKNLIPVIKWAWQLVKPLMSFLIKYAIPGLVGGMGMLIGWVGDLLGLIMKLNNWIDRVIGRFREMGKIAIRVAADIARRLPAPVLGVVSKVTGVQIPPRADGGPVSSGRPYLVGERGPELFVPSRSGGIVPNMALAGAGGITVNLTVHATGGSDAGTGIREGTDYLVKQLERLQRDRERRSYE